MSLIGRFEHLPKRPKSDQARPLLEKIASQVKPIMTKRSWTVGTLAEFLPSDPSLLGNNMNRGQRINLRLRPPGSEGDFYEYDQLVLVMLHELTHNEFGPHDAKFYKLLGELEEEYYDLKRKGFSGEGFHSSGNNLSGIKRDEYAGRLTGLQAAERRLAAQRKIGKGGVLGGRGTAGRSVREVLAEAAERRIRDDKACSAEGSKAVEEEVRKAAEESVGIDAIDLTGEDGDDAGPFTPISTSTSTPSSIGPIRPTHRSGTIASSSSSTSASTSKPPTSRKQPPSSSIPGPSKPIRQPPLPAHEQPTEWSCPTCTLLNPLHHLSCDACATERPPHVKTGWFCGVCGEGPVSWDRWSCEGCGVVRTFG
ncbi:WLM domain-containing protein [Dioszegia hungarica]|uniref:WLM domain-containing protein n=1 Tax=Dioszegia hungarica TaxID=4972 RepID=A0AA38LPC6_9TREE|nr:WLM domain-containing protein [Dioszegia hungarica]KAI9631827.1 WLM domain-containing protein [Dioszegia hungarica]